MRGGRIRTVSEFREAVAAGEGILITDFATGSKFHLNPCACSHVREHYFEKKVIENGERSGSYYAFGSLVEAFEVAPKATACRFCGPTTTPNGTGGPQAMGEAAVSASGTEDVAPVLSMIRVGDGPYSLLLPAIIPYEPKGELLGGREAIRRVLLDLTPEADELLHGVVEGSGLGGTDLDNALLYNIGGRQAGPTRNGVLLERKPGRAGQVGVRYLYGVTKEMSPAPARHRPLALLDGVKLRSQPTSWHQVWSAVRTRSGVALKGHAPAGDLCLDLVVGAPGFTGSANGTFIKTLIDGVLTALHAHRDRVSAEEVGRRMSPKLGLEPSEVSALLLSDHRAVLGTRDRLVVLRRTGVQCQPEDHRLSTIRIEIDRSASEWGLDGGLYLA